MSEKILVDTGPIVAILSPRDDAHENCVKQLGELRPPLFTCWPVLTEVAWLLRSDLKAIHKLLQSLDSSLFRCLDLDQNIYKWLTQFLQQYNDHKVQLADACLMYLAQRENIDSIFTLDRKDFSIYRTDNGTALKIL